MGEIKLDIKGKKILTIGGAGLIGSHTVEALLKEDISQLTIFDNFTRGTTENIESASKDSRVQIYEAGGDITQTDILDSAVKGHDAVLHFAALWLLQCHDFPRNAFEVNVKGSFNVIDACRVNGIQKLIYSSSASVYGDAVQDPMKEDHPFNNKNFYGATKICGEAMLTAYHHRYGLDFIGLRYMNVYGPRQDYNGAYIAVIMKMLDAIDSGQGPTILGDGSECFDFVSVLDCAAANVFALKSSQTNKFYNVGTGQKTSLLQLAKTILELKNSDLEINFAENSKATLVKNRVGDPDLAKNEIGFISKVGLKDGLQKLIDWREQDKKKVSGPL